eukprot:6992088-Ditylum_brightwellii.AAC.1
MAWRIHKRGSKTKTGVISSYRALSGGHTTDAPNTITYSSVVSRDSVCIPFLIAASNELDVMSADIGNAYLNAPCHEKIWTVTGPEFGSKE